MDVTCTSFSEGSTVVSDAVKDALRAYSPVVTRLGGSLTVFALP